MEDFIIEGGYLAKEPELKGSGARRAGDNGVGPQRLVMF